MKLFQPIQGSIESKETQENLIDRGQLQVNVTSSVNAFPVKEARISISYTGIPESTQFAPRTFYRHQNVA